MKRFVEGQSRTQGSLLPETLVDFVAEANPVRVIDVFVEELDLANWASLASTQRPLEALPIT